MTSTSTSTSVSRLRDALLATLGHLPGQRIFHVHVLVSSPRKHAALFPFAIPRPRTYVQDILVLASEQANKESDCVFVTAIEAYIYNVPSTRCGIMYISKVDSTAQGSSPSPTTALVRSLLAFYSDPETRPIDVDTLWIQLFARAQGQYLFPNSADYERKKPLSDVQLCSWWKRVFSLVADDVDARTNSKAVQRLFWIMPGMNELEATLATKSPIASLPKTRAWTYGHPYSQVDIPLPCPKYAGEGHNLGHLIPFFDDDPKARFIDEIAYITQGDEVKSPKRKRTRIEGHTPSAGDDRPPSQSYEQEEKDKDKPIGELGKVSANEFWERMSFRQECVQGATTGFFSLGVSAPPKNLEGPRPSPLEPQPGQVSSKLNKRVLKSLMTGVEFSNVDRAVKGTEVIEEAIRGLCEGITPVEDNPIKPVRRGQLLTSNTDHGRRTPEPPSSSSMLVPPSTPPRRSKDSAVLLDVSPNPFEEPTASLDTYQTHIYGSVDVKNPHVQGKSSTESRPLGGADNAPSVTVLTVRRKKRPAD